MPRVMATIEMRIIGFEKELLLPLIIFFAKKSSKFKGRIAFVNNKFREMRMQMNHWKNLLLILVLTCICSCVQEGQSQTSKAIEPPSENHEIILGNARMESYLPLLKDKKVAFVGNHTSTIGGVHLVDTLLSRKVQLVCVFSPEHGFRGEADAGETVDSEIDGKTNLPIISLYGSNKKPTVDQLKGIDIIVFDIQDVGARFYTYISTLHYVMEAAAESNIPLLLLDRPNPNGHYVDGPVLQEKFSSFVGLHPIPVVHGMTIGEYAQMINGEQWLSNGIQCDLTVISCEHYTHDSRYEISQAPSPNLPNMKAIYLYPSICFLEGTPISVGRGTNKPFQQIGHPSFNSKYSFTPKPTFGAKDPKLKGKQCRGTDLSQLTTENLSSKDQIELSYLLKAYEQFEDKPSFFTNYFNLLAGNDRLQKSIKAGMNEEQIKAAWQKELEAFGNIRKKYLLYKDFQ